MHHHEPEATRPLLNSNYHGIQDLSFSSNPALEMQATNSVLNEDLFIQMLSYLNGSDRVACAQACKEWKNTVYIPELWPKLNLSNYSHGVHDSLLEHILVNNRPRFTMITELNLEGCTALTYRCLGIIAQNCPHLEVLLLTGCKRIPPIMIVHTVAKLPHLRKLELYNVTDDFSIIRQIRTCRPWIDLGKFWLQYLARECKSDPRMIMEGLHGARYIRGRDRPFMEQVQSSDEEIYGIEIVYEQEDRHPPPGYNNLLPPLLEECGCRYEDENQEACMGDITGKIVYCNQSYHRGGNYPNEVRYVCSHHEHTHLTEEDTYKVCNLCEKLFRAESCFTPFQEPCCKVCVDEEKLQDKDIWVRLTNKDIEQFDYGNIVHNAVQMADYRNLPPRLKKIGEVQCNLDFTPFAEEDLFEDLERVPMNSFWISNEQRVNRQKDEFKTLLKRAKKQNNTRALLVYHPEDQEKVVVMADRGLLFGGPSGQDYVNLTISAWSKFVPLTLPVLVVSILTIVLCWHMEFFKQKFLSPTVETMNLTNKPKPSLASQFIIIGIAIFLGVIIVFVLLCRFRQLCERFFRYFLVVDIFILLSCGGFLLTWIPLANYGVTVDYFTIGGCFWNFGIVGLLTLYKNVPGYLHCSYLVALFTIMSVLITSMLTWYVTFFIAILALVDGMAMFRDDIANMFTPFILPTNLQIPNTTPKIFYEVEDLRLRAFDFMFYGMMPGILGVEFEIIPEFIILCSILTGYVLCVFVLPFFSLKKRPLPIAFLFVIVFHLLTKQFIKPYFLESDAKWHYICA